MRVNIAKQNRWYVVYTNPNTEKRIYTELGRRAIKAFLPTKKVERQWKDRKKKLDVPLFPNYVFVNVAPDEMWTVLMVNGVVKFVSFNGSPAVVRDTEIELVKKVLAGASVVSGEEVALQGETVRVMQGPLSGLTGRVLNSKGVTRLCLELETVNQIISVDIDAALLARVN